MFLRVMKVVASGSFPTAEGSLGDDAGWSWLFPPQPATSIDAAATTAAAAARRREPPTGELERSSRARVERLLTRTPKIKTTRNGVRDRGETVVISQQS